MFMQCKKLAGNVILLSIFITGCGTVANATPLSPTPTPALPLTLQFIGNSCTLIIAPDGTRIVSDPYNRFQHPAGIGELPKDLAANIVTISHAHPDHNNIKAVAGSPKVLTEPGVYQAGMVKVTGYGGFEGSPSGPSSNPHVIFVFEVGGIKIVHLGDSGSVTQPEILAAIENADLLLLNIDGYVIPADQIVPFLQQAKVRTFIPTHYSMRENARWQGAPTADEFLKTLPADLAVVRMGSEIQVTPNMPTQVVILSPLTQLK